MDLARTDTEPVAQELWAGEVPRTVFRFVLATSGWHQLVLVPLTAVVFLLEVVPLELRRRIVDDLVKHRDFGWVVGLGAFYVGIVLVQGGTKLVLNIYHGWVSARATRDLRHRVQALVRSASPASLTREAEGIQASMIVAEVEAVGGFVGGAISEPLLHGGIVCSVLAYMIHVDIWMAGAVLALLVPQLVFVPLMQNAMNRLTRARVRIVRQLSISAVRRTGSDEARAPADDDRIQRVFELDVGIFRFKFTMNFLMNLSTHLQVVGVLLAGGWAVYAERLDIGGVVAVVSGISRLTDPWGDLVNYFRELNNTHVKYGLVRDAIIQQAQEVAL